MVYNYVFERCLRNLAGNGRKINFYKCFSKSERSEPINSSSLKNMKFRKKWCNLIVIEFSTIFSILVFGVVEMRIFSQ